MRNCWNVAVITRTCTKSNCWKKNSNAHEQHSGRRSARQGVRLAPDEKAAAIHAAVRLACGVRSRAGHGGDAARACAAGPFSKSDRQLPRAGDERDPGPVKRLAWSSVDQPAVFRCPRL